uniref:Uncharacterized protein n=1 Tax=Rhizophora mucronata TaxID=61149 RepID=A0A2P2KCU5_RHIMU
MLLQPTYIQLVVLADPEFTQTCTHTFVDICLYL